MTFVGAASTFARRFLSDRTFELIVMPALADFEFDAAAGASRTRARLAVLKALAGGAVEEAADGSGLLTFACLVLIPACYYCFLVALISPVDLRTSLTSSTVVGLAIAVLGVSLVPALACFWPDRSKSPAESESE